MPTAYRRPRRPRGLSLADAFATFPLNIVPGPDDVPGDCHLWTGACTRSGDYGVIRFGGQNLRAHRVSWQIVHGDLAPTVVLDHLCHNPRCVNVAHLRAVTQKQNLEHRAGANRRSKSGVRGVCWHPPTGKWRAYVGHNGQQTHVGLFTDLDAAKAAVRERRNELFTCNDTDR